jgi:hypothetical protein
MKPGGARAISLSRRRLHQNPTRLARRRPLKRNRTSPIKSENPALLAAGGVFCFPPSELDSASVEDDAHCDRVYAAIEAVRPLAVHFGVFAPMVVKVKAQMKIQTAGADHTTTAAQVTEAIKNYINALGLGATLPFTRLAQIAYDASPAVKNVSAVQLNGATDDLIATKKQTFKAEAIVVT